MHPVEIGDVYRVRTCSGALLEIPSVFCGYKILRTIGSGYDTVVLLVEHESTHRKYAAKATPRDTNIAALERELRLITTVRHPNIVHTHEVLYEPNFIFVIMEFYRRGDLLSKIVRQTRIEMGELPVLFRGVVEALSYLHHHGWAHRDIKPENVLLGDNGEVLLADFGLARESRQDVLMMTRCGTICYLAPEIIRCEPYDGKKSDIWALGVMLYAMATGNIPWQSGNELLMPEMIMHQRIMPPPGMAHEVADIITQCTEPDPDKRPTTDDLLRNPWIAMSEPRMELAAMRRDKVSSTHTTFVKQTKRDVRFLKPPVNAKKWLVRPTMKLQRGPATASANLLKTPKGILPVL